MVFFYWKRKNKMTIERIDYLVDKLFQNGVFRYRVCLKDGIVSVSESGKYYTHDEVIDVIKSSEHYLDRLLDKFRHKHEIAITPIMEEIERQVAEGDKYGWYHVISDRLVIYLLVIKKNALKGKKHYNYIKT